MIRRDYILRMIEEFIRALARIREQREQHDWRAAEAGVEEEVRRLTGVDLSTISILTDMEILSRLLTAGNFQAHTEKIYMLARVLIEAAEIADAEGRQDSGRSLRLKALHLLLHAELRGEIFEWPEFVPNIDFVLQRFSRPDLPIHTQALLMQFFERTGQFAKAEDALHVILEHAPDHPELKQLAISFYQRLLQKNDAALSAGNLPREEIVAALQEIENLPSSILPSSAHPA